MEKSGGYKNVWKEKGFWIEIVVLSLLLFVMITQNPHHFPTEKWIQQMDHILMHILLLLISIIQLSKIVVVTLQRHIRPEMMFAYSFLIIIFIGAVGLIIIAVIPFFFNGVFGANVSFGGTSLIIIVSVILETIKQIESLMLVRNYKGFLNA